MVIEYTNIVFCRLNIDCLACFDPHWAQKWPKIPKIATNGTESPLTSYKLYTNLYKLLEQFGNILIHRYCIASPTGTKTDTKFCRIWLILSKTTAL